MTRTDRAGSPVARARGLRKDYRDVVALDGVELVVPSGQVVALLGRNGAGKTTLLNLLAGLLHPDGGELQVPPRRGLFPAVGFAPQELGLYLALTGRENLRFFAAIEGLRRPDADRAIEALADPLGLHALLSRPVHTLSTGQRRRVHVAAAMLHRPALLLLDEPTAGVDVATRASILDAVRAAAAAGAGVCYSTHYFSEVEAIATTVVILSAGKVVATGTVEDLKSSQPASRIEMTFTGPPPSLHFDSPVERTATGLIIHTPRPDVDTARALAALGAHRARLTSIQVNRPSLETFFLQVTGRSVDYPDENENVRIPA